MKNYELINEIEKIISPLLNSASVDLVEIELKGAIGNQVLRIFVDVEGGINLNQCVELSRNISDILDIKDFMPGKYRLEVSSPGVDRPLKTTKDFARNVGRHIKIYYNSGKTDEGEILNIDNDTLFIKQGENQIKVNLPSITKAKLLVKI